MTESDLESAGKDWRYAVEFRNRTILEARRNGMGFKRISIAVGMSKAAVMKIVENANNKNVET